MDVAAPACPAACGAPDDRATLDRDEEVVGVRPDQPGELLERIRRARDRVRPLPQRQHVGTFFETARPDLDHRALTPTDLRLTLGDPYHTWSHFERRPMAIKREFTLDAKYRQEEGQIFLSGIQALVRLPLDQHRADKRRGLNTATLISGYRGSPLGGLDLTLERNPDLLRQHNVVFLSGANEDLGATAGYDSKPSYHIH